MNDKKALNFKWEKIVDKIYKLNDDFDYVLVKKLVKEINTFNQQLEKKQKEIVCTLNYSNFNNNKKLKKELEDFLIYINEFILYLNNFISLKPTTKKGYYNYLKNAIAYL